MLLVAFWGRTAEIKQRQMLQSSISIFKILATAWHMFNVFIRSLPEHVIDAENTTDLILSKMNELCWTCFNIKLLVLCYKLKSLRIGCAISLLARSFRRFDSVWFILFVPFRSFVVDAFYISHRDGAKKDNLLQCNSGLIY